MYDFATKKTVLLKKGSGEKQGLIQWEITKNGVLHAEIELYEGNDLTGHYLGAEGTARGCGYDKVSAAIADACKKAGILADHQAASDFTFNDSDLAERHCVDTCTVPVYAGTGNQARAFSLFFDVLEA
jgi:hypothetical protein